MPTCVDTAIDDLGGPVAEEPKLHFRATLLQKGLDPANAAVPDTRSHSNGTENVFHAAAPEDMTAYAGKPGLRTESQVLSAF